MELVDYRTVSKSSHSNCLDRSPSVTIGNDLVNRCTRLSQDLVAPSVVKEEPASDDDWEEAAESSDKEAPMASDHGG